MIFIAIIINSILALLLVYVYYRYQKIKIDRGSLIKAVLFSNVVTIVTLYLLKTINPNYNLRDIFQTEMQTELIGGSNRYISEIGESVFFSAPPF